MRRDRRLTRRQRAYLKAFDQVLQAHDGFAYSHAREAMLAKLGPLLKQRGVTPAGRQRPTPRT